MISDCCCCKILGGHSTVFWASTSTSNCSSAVNEMCPQILSKIHKLPNALPVSTAPEALLAGCGTHVCLQSSAGAFTLLQAFSWQYAHWAVLVQWHTKGWWAGRGNVCARLLSEDHTAGGHQNWGKMNLQQPMTHLDYWFYLWSAHPWVKTAGRWKKWHTSFGRQAFRQIGNFWVGEAAQGRSDEWGRPSGDLGGLPLPLTD